MKTIKCDACGKTYNEEDFNKLQKISFIKKEFKFLEKRICDCSHVLSMEKEFEEKEN